ncbi:tail fiber domain-containing protein, partial [Candidatus Dependentiae bacterium]|nr:tail fiber domain-containing protein [Candidatus Dependentiae bacterium]
GHIGTGWGTNNIAAIRIVAAEDFSLTNQGSKIDFATTNIGATSRTVRMTIANDGNVGIGTTSPTRAKLVVSGSVSYDNGSFGYLASNATTGTSSGSVNTSIYADGRIVCYEFNANSDARIKNIIEVSDSRKDLELLNQIKVTDYTYIDTIAQGSQISKKVIAQELQNVLPAAVKKSLEFVPDIFVLAKSVMFEKKSKMLTITLDKQHNLKIGDKVRMILRDKKVEKIVAEIINNYVFSVSDWSDETQKIFVYGKEVDDFLTVDYDAVTMLSVSAIQELIKQNVIQKNETETLKNLISELKQRIEKLEK